MENLNILINKIESLLELEEKHPNLIDTPLLEYITKWITLSDNEKVDTLSILHMTLVDGQDCDQTGTQWEKEWLENGKVCLCPACNTARECISIIENIGTL